jgi:hypothetical protein
MLPLRALAGSDTLGYTSALEELRRFRGRIYLEDGAIPADALTDDGRHVLPHDTNWWHLFLVGHDGSVTACIRLTRYTDDFSICGSFAYSCMCRMAADSQNSS